MFSLFNNSSKIGQLAVILHTLKTTLTSQVIPWHIGKQQLQQQGQQQLRRYLSHSHVNYSRRQSALICGRECGERSSGGGHSICLVILPLTFASCSAADPSAGSGTKLSFAKAFSSSSSASKAADDLDKMASEDYKNAKSIYDFTVKDTHGNDVSLQQYKGNVVLIVNIASKCGLTKNNYKKLTDLKEKYGDKGLKILNFPCNQFGSQMPEADGEPMVCHLRDSKADIGEVFQKIDVNGAGTAPLYQYLKAKQSGTLGSAIKWNFTKFLVNKDGIPVDRYAPTTDPMDIAKDIEKLL